MEQNYLAKRAKSHLIQGYLSFAKSVHVEILQDKDGSPHVSQVNAGMAAPCTFTAAGQSLGSKIKEIFNVHSEYIRFSFFMHLNNRR